MPGRRQAWWLACRPKTLSVSLSPVLVGTALAAHDGNALSWLPVLAAVLGAAFIQIGTNLFNDVGDFLRGTDQAGRIGPARASAEGWLTPVEVARGAWFSFALAFLCGVYLVLHAGWPIVVIGLASLFAGWAYTGGPRPIAYGPFGEFFVLLFFGLLAVGGSYLLQSPALSPGVAVAGLMLGVLAAAVITVNNTRDRVGDQAAGRRTLAVCVGRPAMNRLYAAELLLPYTMLPFFWPTAAGLPMLSLPVALWLIRRFRRQPEGPVFNALLAATAGLQLLFAVLLSLSFVI